MISLSRYEALFRVPGLRSAVAASIVGRLPIGIATLAILLFIQARTESFAVAGAAAAFYVLGLATVAPFLGRMIDRLGPRPVLVASAAIYPTMLVAMIVLTLYGGSQGWVAALTFVAGAAFPPITICMRALYPRLVPDPALLQTAYSVDSALIEMIFIAGPALVALLVATGYPFIAVLFAAACASTGIVIFLRAPAVRSWKIYPGAGRRSLIGPLRQARLIGVYAATLLYSFAFGLYEIAVTAFATGQGVPAAAGVILAFASVGSAMGAIVYGARDWGPPLPRQFLIAVALMASGLLVLAPITHLYWFALMSVIACAPMAPVLAVQSLLVSRLAPRDMLAESFTWGATCLLAGISAGIACGGLLAEFTSPSRILLASAASAILAGAVVRATVRE